MDDMQNNGGIFSPRNALGIVFFILILCAFLYFKFGSFTFDQVFQKATQPLESAKIVYCSVKGEVWSEEESQCKLMDSTVAAPAKNLSGEKNGVLFMDDFRGLTFIVDEACSSAFIVRKGGDTDAFDSYLISTTDEYPIAEYALINSAHYRFNDSYKGKKILFKDDQVGLFMVKAQDFSSKAPGNIETLEKCHFRIEKN